MEINCAASPMGSGWARFTRLVVLGLTGIFGIGSATRPVWGQSAWPSYPNNSAIAITPGGNVGIGTANPAASLVVQTGPTSDVFIGNSIFNGRGELRLYGQQNWGAAIIGNQYYDGVSAVKRVTAGGGGWFFIDNTMGTTAGDISFATWGAAAADSVISPVTTVTIKNSGNVGIGTTNPQYLLSVKGTIGAQEVVVTNTGWSDYVLRTGYYLRPLSEVGAFIEQNHHLPDIPSEGDVKEHGISVGEMQSKLLAKIEELTLYVMQADEGNKRLQDQNRELLSRLARVEKMIDAGGASAATK